MLLGLARLRTSVGYHESFNVDSTEVRQIFQNLMPIWPSDRCSEGIEQQPTTMSSSFLILACLNLFLHSNNQALSYSYSTVIVFWKQWHRLGGFRPQA